MKHYIKGICLLVIFTSLIISGCEDNSGDDDDDEYSELFGTWVYSGQGSDGFTSEVFYISSELCVADLFFDSDTDSKITHMVFDVVSYDPAAGHFLLYISKIAGETDDPPASDKVALKKAREPQVGDYMYVTYSISGTAMNLAMDLNNTYPASSNAGTEGTDYYTFTKFTETATPDFSGTWVYTGQGSGGLTSEIFSMNDVIVVAEMFFDDGADTDITHLVGNVDSYDETAGHILIDITKIAGDGSDLSETDFIYITYSISGTTMYVATEFNGTYPASSNTGTEGTDYLTFTKFTQTNTTDFSGTWVYTGQGASGMTSEIFSMNDVIVVAEMFFDDDGTDTNITHLVGNVASYDETAGHILIDVTKISGDGSGLSDTDHIYVTYSISGTTMYLATEFNGTYPISSNTGTEGTDYLTFKKF